MGSKVQQKKLVSRKRTKLRIRKNVIGTATRPRLSVFKSSKHTYVQLIDDIAARTLVSASTLDKEIADQISSLKSGEESKDKASSLKSVLAGQAVGMLLAKRGKEKSITQAIFDRNGYVYKGRVQAVADGARKGGLKF